jgi:glycerophosphoryl diester phosphodiesterase
VAHGGPFLKLKKTIEEMYLDPLHEWIRLNNGTVYTNDPEPLVLMIDLKGDGRKSYPVLHSILSRYEDMLTVYSGDSVKHGPVRICISGSRPYDLILDQPKRYVTIDGRIDRMVYSDLLPTELERVSDPYGRFFKWRGIGKMPEKQKKLLHDLVENAHAYGREIRFYGARNNARIWKMLLDAGVDWINVDDLGKFRQFYRRYEKKKE